MNDSNFRILAVNGVYFTTVPKHDTWETLTEHNAY